ncbi:hypothetical protein Tco_1431605 [Tanacetum coccineum]
MVVQNQSEMGEDDVVLKELRDSLVRAATTASSLEAEQDSGNVDKTRSKATPNESSSQRTNLVGGPRCQEAMGDTIAQTSLKMMVKKLEKRNRSRTHKLKRLYKVGLTARVESSKDEASLDKERYDVIVLGGEEVFPAGQNENVIEEVVNAAQDKGKVIMIKEPVKLKKKVQIMFDEETAKRLQAEFDEEEILAREKAEKEQEANIALIEEWDDIQAKIDVAYQLAERLQA